MGAHSLGKASRDNSGFDGQNGWVDDEFTLGKQELPRLEYTCFASLDSTLFAPTCHEGSKVKRKGTLIFMATTSGCIRYITLYQLAH